MDEIKYEYRLLCTRKSGEVNELLRIDNGVELLHFLEALERNQEMLRKLNNAILPELTFSIHKRKVETKTHDWEVMIQSSQYEKKAV